MIVLWITAELTNNIDLCSFCEKRWRKQSGKTSSPPTAKHNIYTIFSSSFFFLSSLFFLSFFCFFLTSIILHRRKTSLVNLSKKKKKRLAIKSVFFLSFLMPFSGFIICFLLIPSFFVSSSPPSPPLPLLLPVFPRL